MSNVKDFITFVVSCRFHYNKYTAPGLVSFEYYINNNLIFEHYAWDKNNANTKPKTSRNIYKIIYENDK